MKSETIKYCPKQKLWPYGNVYKLCLSIALYRSTVLSQSHFNFFPPPKYFEKQYFLFCNCYAQECKIWYLRLSFLLDLICMLHNESWKHFFLNCQWNMLLIKIESKQGSIVIFLNSKSFDMYPRSPPAPSIIPMTNVQTSVQCTNNWSNSAHYRANGIKSLPFLKKMQNRWSVAS